MNKRIRSVVFSILIFLVLAFITSAAATNPGEDLTGALQSIQNTLFALFSVRNLVDLVVAWVLIYWISKRALENRKFPNQVHLMISLPFALGFALFMINNDSSLIDVLRDLMYLLVVIPVFLFIKNTTIKTGLGMIVLSGALNIIEKILPEVVKNIPFLKSTIMPLLAPIGLIILAIGIIQEVSSSLRGGAGGGGGGGGGLGNTQPAKFLNDQAQERGQLEQRIRNAEQRENTLNRRVTDFGARLHAAIGMGRRPIVNPQRDNLVNMARELRTMADELDTELGDIAADPLMARTRGSGRLAVFSQFSLRNRLRGEIVNVYGTTERQFAATSTRLRTELIRLFVNL